MLTQTDSSLFGKLLWNPFIYFYRDNLALQLTNYFVNKFSIFYRKIRILSIDKSMGNCQCSLQQQEKLEIVVSSTDIVVPSTNIVMPSSSNLMFATLNYGGVIKSPFQFFSQDQEQEKKISEIFVFLLPIYVKSFEQSTFEWDIGKIDLKLQTERYCPLYNKEVGIDKSKNMLVSGKQFKRLWDQQYNRGTIKTNIHPQPTKTQIYNMRLFDTITYHTLVSHIYQLDQTKQIDSLDLQSFSILPYQQFMQKKFSQSFLDEEKKSQKVISALSKVDVAFLQEPTGLLIEKLKKKPELIIREKGDGQSMIVLRKEKFLSNSAKDHLTLKKLGSLQSSGAMSINGNRDCVYICVDRFIFISVHLASKEAKNIIQVQAMKTLLNQLKKNYWNYNIILGGDTNSFVEAKGLSEQFKIYSSLPTSITTRKKRTFLQPQFKKADKVIESCKDHIISTVDIENFSIQMIDGSKIDGQELLPTDRHPFDHFMVVGEMKRD